MSLATASFLFSRVKNYQRSRICRKQKQFTGQKEASAIGMVSKPASVIITKKQKIG